MRLRRVAVALGLALTLGVAAVHVEFHRHAGGLWRDEVNSVNVATRPRAADVVRLSHLDSFPMAWVLLLHAWIRAGFGDGDAELRGLGLVVAAGLVATLWWAGTRLRAGPPLVSLLLLALSPTTIVYGSQVRGYGLGTLAVVWAAGAFWSFVERPSRGRALVALAAAILAAQSYFGNAFLLLAVCLSAAAIAFRRGTPACAAAAIALGGLAGVSLLANLPAVLYAARLSPIEKSSYSVGWLAYVFWGALGPGMPALAVLWAIVLGLAAVGIAVAWRSPDGGDRARYAAYTALSGTLGYYAFTKYIGVQTNYWYYLPLMALLALAAEVGVDLLARRLPHGVGLRAGAVALAALAITPGVTRTVRVRMTNVDLVAAAVAESARPSDFVVVAPWYTGITFARYYRGAAPWTTLPPLATHAFHLHAELIQQMQRGDAAIAGTLAQVESTLRGGGRVWIVGPLAAPPAGAAPPHLPPWPKGPEGALNGPYLDGWGLQLGAFIRAHGADVRQIHFPAVAAVNRWENQPLEVVEGWRDAAG